ncbi:MAG: hybrid sensor histidine kinase/response regulator transcription factor [Calditrichia bacterium]
MRHIRATCILLMILVSSILFAQTNSENWREAGVPYIQNYSPSDYGYNPQNWAAAQDEAGILYFGNTDGLLEFDGTHWKLHALPRRSPVRAIAMDKDRIYIGSSGEIGFFKRDSYGTLTYTSLMNKIPEEFRDFRSVWSIYVSERQVFFRTNTHVIRLKDDTCNLWRTKTRYHQSYFIDNVLYVLERNIGLKFLSGDSLQLAPAGEFFKDKFVFSFLPFEQGKYLLTSRQHGMFIYDTKSVEPFFMPEQQFVSDSRPFNGVALGNGLFALATLRNGLLLFDKSGNVQQVINKTIGLQDNYCTSIFRDRENGIWVTLNNGLSRIELIAPLTRFRHDTGLNGTIVTALRHDSKLYVGSTSGLFVLDPSHRKNQMNSSSKSDLDRQYVPRFQLIPDLPNQVWDIKEIDGKLLVSSNLGLAEVRNDKSFPIYEWQTVQPSCMFNSEDYPDYLFVGLWRGLSFMKKENNRWVFHSLIDSVKGRITNIVQMSADEFWLSMHEGLAYKLKLSNIKSDDPFRDIILTEFNQDSGIPINNVYAAMIDGALRIGTQGGLMRFNEANQRFEHDPTFGEIFADSSTWVFYLDQDQHDNVWIVAGKGKQTVNGKAIKNPDGSYSWFDEPFLRMDDMGDVFSIYPEKNGDVWFVGSEGVARYNHQLETDNKNAFHTQIHAVNNIRNAEDLSTNKTALDEMSLSHAENSLRFLFSSATFHNTAANRFQFKLEGFDDNWSDWTSETRKDYTGIFEGNYTFKVRSKNIYGKMGTEAALKIDISPPWYRSWPAYLFYLILATGFVYSIVQARVRRFRKQQERLESMITERTAQVVEQRNQLAEQSEKLKELDELKSQFFANISHEFRTPLTLIIGMIDNLKKRANETSDQKELGLIELNADRLLNLINQLLDLSKLEAGELKIAATEGDIARFIRRIFASFASLAPQRQITLTLNDILFEEAKDVDVIKAWFDKDKLEKVFYNLLSNAFKFTPTGGRIDLSYKLNPDNDEVVFRVLNTGPGIPPEKLPHIFERFYQVEGNSKREFEGTGIGLALVKELVGLHHGTVTAHSKQNVETSFEVVLPIGKSVFTEEELGQIQEIVTSEHAIQSPAHLDAGAINNSDARASDSESTNSEPDDTLVLIVEDHHDLRRFICESLQSHYSVIEAENGRIGVEKAIARIPDLIISDVMMPEMDGYELCAELKTNEKTNHIPIILLTAKAAQADKMAGLETGADDYLLKPFNPDELQVRVRNLIKIRRSMRDKFSGEMLLRPTDITVSSVHQIFLEKLTGIIEAHMDNEEFSVEGLANEIGMSRGQLHRKLKALTNQSTSEFIRTFRLQRAAELIKQHAGNIAEIAYQVGFSSQAYFTRCFQEQFNCSPTEYRKREAQ